MSLNLFLVLPKACGMGWIDKRNNNIPMFLPPDRHNPEGEFLLGTDNNSDLRIGLNGASPRRCRRQPNGLPPA